MSEHIIIVDDDHDLRELIADVLGDEGYSTRSFASGDAALEALRKGLQADVVLTDRIMPGMRGDELVQEIRGSWPEINVIVMTGFGSIESAVELIKDGAFDYVAKPFSNQAIVFAVQRALEESQTRRALAASRRVPDSIPGMIGSSEAVQELTRMIARAAVSRHPVLITGESGTGKELVAEAIHRISGRQKLVAVNCGALPENLLESELFGHEKGSFTGADRTKAGLLEEAAGGTAFLDEIGEMPLALQPKLLRALEEGEVRRIGSNRSQRLDFRVVSATNRNLEAEVEAGRFREDLYWRLNVLTLEVPPLRDRPGDIPMLAQHFLTPAPGGGTLKTIASEAMALLKTYPWPGNVRELRNAVQRAEVMATDDRIGPGDLPPRIREAAGPGSVLAEASEGRITLRDLERRYILEVVKQAGGNKSQAAKILGLDRKTLYRKLEEYGEAAAGGPDDA